MAMKILQTKDVDMFEILFTPDESLLVSTLIFHTYAVFPLWIVPTDNYEAKFGVTEKNAEKIFSAFRERYYEKVSPLPVLLSKNELQAVKKIIEYMTDKWSDDDFSTIAATEKSKAIELIKQFDEQGF